MSTDILRETNDWTIEYDDDLAAVVHRWTNHTTGDRFREGCERILDVVEEHGASKLLIDSREVTALKQDDIGWMFGEWVPRMIDAGVEMIAVVYPESTVAKMNIDAMSERVDGMEQAEEVEDAAEQHLTTEMAEARSWLANR